jgi:pimeloyl-ACP methyl ester carboxylesterase
MLKNTFKACLANITVVVAVALLALGLGNFVLADQPVVDISSGTLEGSIYTIAKPENWQGSLLLIAHGLRPENADLSASLDLNRSVYAKLLDLNWMLASTSYRRNGLIIHDAVEDLENLRKHIIKTHGEPKRILIMGDSMGGAIGVLIAETLFEHYDGILAVGAALHVRDPEESLSPSYLPQIPLLFLSNQDELAEPEEYVSRTTRAQFPPALWKVARDGHVNVSDSEREAALLALNEYINSGHIEHNKDGTIAGQFQASTAEHTQAGASGEITQITDVFGNFFTSYVADDLGRLGVERESYFHLSFGEHTVRVYWGATYSDVSKGEWVAFISPEGNLMVARNMENACETINCKINDRVLLFP